MNWAPLIGQSGENRKFTQTYLDTFIFGVGLSLLTFFDIIHDSKVNLDYQGYFVYFNVHHISICSCNCAGSH